MTYVFRFDNSCLFDCSSFVQSYDILVEQPNFSADFSAPRINLNLGKQTTNMIAKLT